MQIPVLAFEIALLVIFSLLWADRLFRKGKKLRIKQSKVSEERCSQYEDQEGAPREKNLLKKTKELRIARLSYNEAEIAEKETALKDYLASVYEERLQRSNNEDSRRSMMMLIRTELIQNPYDHIGRSMASDVKQIFLRQVLEENIARIAKLP